MADSLPSVVDETVPSSRVSNVLAVVAASLSVTVIVLEEYRDDDVTLLLTFDPVMVEAEEAVSRDESSMVDMEDRDGCSPEVSVYCVRVPAVELTSRSTT